MKKLFIAVSIALICAGSAEAGLRARANASARRGLFGRSIARARAVVSDRGCQPACVTEPVCEPICLPVIPCPTPQPCCQTPPCGSASASACASSSGGVAHAKASAMARSGRRGHVRGGYARGASKEGVGFSSASAQAALSNCCFSGRRPIVDQAVVRGRDGWYAVKHFR